MYKFVAKKQLVDFARIVKENQNEDFLHVTYFTDKHDYSVYLVTEKGLSRLKASGIPYSYGSIQISSFGYPGNGGNKVENVYFMEEASFPKHMETLRRRESEVTVTVTPIRID